MSRTLNKSNALVTEKDVDKRKKSVAAEQAESMTMFNVGDMLSNSMTGYPSAAAVASKTGGTLAKLAPQASKPCIVLMLNPSVTDELRNAVGVIGIFMCKDGKNRDVMIGGILTLFGLVNVELFDDQAFKTHLLKLGLNLKVVTISVPSDLCNIISTTSESLETKLKTSLEIPDKHHLTGQVILPDAANSLHEDIPGFFQYDPLCIMTHVGITLALFTKQLADVNHAPWVDRRWSGFTTGIGIPAEMSASGPGKAFVPTLSECVAIHTVMSAAHAIRREIFQRVLGLIYEDAIPNRMCLQVVTLSRGAEMNHIHLINKYILKTHPSLVTLPSLSAEFTTLYKAMVSLLALDEASEFWPWLKVMRQPKDLDFFNRANFTTLTYIATRIGKRQLPSLAAYNGAMAVTTDVEEIAKVAIQFAYSVKAMSLIGDPSATEINEVSHTQLKVIETIADRMATGPKSDPQDESLLVNDIPESLITQPPKPPVPTAK